MLVGVMRWFKSMGSLLMVAIEVHNNEVDKVVWSSELYCCRASTTLLPCLIVALLQPGSLVNPGASFSKSFQL